MDNLDDLKALWHTAKTDVLPSSKEMLQIILKFRKQKLRSKWMIIIVSLLLSAALVFIMIHTPFKMLSTYIGGSLMAVSGLILAATNIKSLKRFYQLDDCSNLEFVAFIEQTRQNQIFYYKKTQVILMSLNTVGLSLYLYESLKDDFLPTLILYGVTTGFLFFNWFFLRPRSYKKNAAKLAATKQHFEKISNQLK